MTLLLAETLVVTMDEPCLLLAEMNLKTPDSRDWHRYQILTVIRDDRPATARFDFGRAKDYFAPEFRIAGGWQRPDGKIEILHTVGELRDIADYQRAGMWRQPEVVPSDLVTDFHKHTDAVNLQRRRRSSFGARHRVQRG